MSWRSKQWLVLLCAAAACGGGEEEVEVAPGAETVAAAPQVQPLSGGEAVGVLRVVSEGAARSADTLLAVTELAELRRLLSVVRADHEALQKELSAIADSLQLTPLQHAAAERVRTLAQTSVSQAGGWTRGAADAQVLEQQVQLHTTLLAVLDSTVLPGLATARDTTLVAQYARAVRPAVAAHLQRAHQIEVLLRNRPAPAPSPARTTPRPTTPAPAQPQPQPQAPATIDTTPPPPDTTAAGRR